MRAFLALFFLFCTALKAETPFVVCTEAGQINLPDGYPSVYYRIFAKNLPSGKKFKLLRSNLSGKKELLGEYSSDEKGVLQESIQMIAYYCPGEPFEFIVESEDRDQAKASVVPLPIEIVQEGCKISVELASADGKTFICKGEGFEPGEKIRICSISLGNAIDNVVSAGVNGAFTMTIKPAVKKKKGGKCALEVRRQKETLSLKFAWGKEALLKPTASLSAIPTKEAYEKALERVLANR